MKHLFTLIVAALLLPSVSIAAKAPIEEATLKYDITIEGPTIMLSDVLSGSERASKISVAQAPRPGQSISLNPVAVYRLAVRHRIRWIPPQGIERIPVRRSSRIVDAVLLRDEIAMALADAAPDHDLEIQFAGSRATIHIASDADTSINVESLEYDARSGRFAAIVAAPANDPAAPRHRVMGRAWRMMEIPVLAQRITPGHEIEARDINYKRVRADRVRSQTVQDASEMIGMSLKRNLAPQRPIRRNDLRRPVMIAKGDIVTMQFRAGGLVLTAAGRAVEDGGRNATIRIRNERSRLTIEGRIIAPGQVVVGEPMPQLSQLQN